MVLSKAKTCFYCNIGGTGATPATADCLDEQYLRVLYARGPDVLPLNSFSEGYPALVARCKASGRRWKVLMYTNVCRCSESDPQRLQGELFLYVLANSTTHCFINQSNGLPRITGTTPNRTAFVDLTSPVVRAGIVDFLVHQLSSCGADGIFVDGHHAEIDDIESLIVNGATKNNQQSYAAAAFIRELKRAIAPKTVWMNGQWAHDGTRQRDLQAMVIGEADGCTIEYHTRDGHANNPVTADTFKVFVLDTSVAGQLWPEKAVLARGTEQGQTYFAYSDEYARAFYSFCAWNCITRRRDRNDYWTYGQNFSVETRLTLERHGGTAYYDFQDLRLGEPVAPAVLESGGWRRDFEGGVVYVSPEDSGSHTWAAPDGGWLPGGARVELGAQIVVPDARGQILLFSKPQPPKTITVDTSMGTTDWLVETAVSRYRYRNLYLRFRSTDIAGALMVRVEVESDSPRPYGRLEVMPVGGTFVPGNADFPYIASSSFGASNIDGPTYTADGSWQELNLDPVTLARASGVQCCRVVSIRAIGTVEVSHIVLSEPDGYVDSWGP